MTTRFQLKCLGEPALTRADGQAVRIKVRKHMALLIYLVLESDRRHQREKLAELLWSNLPESDARHSVATALTSLRAAFGQEVFDANTNGVRWSFPAARCQSAFVAQRLRRHVPMFYLMSKAFRNSLGPARSLHCICQVWRYTLYK